MASGFSGFKNHALVVSLWHQRVHQGLYFTADRTVLGTLGNNATIEILLQVGALEIHLREFANASADATLEIFEGPTFSAAGTALPIINKNRRSSIVSTCTATHTPTTSDDGTELDTLYMPGGSGGNASGASASFEVEWLLAANTNYLIRLTNVDGANQSGHLHLEWYEELTGAELSLG